MTTDPFDNRVRQARTFTLHTVRHGTAGPPLVILHGLLGSNRNWHSVARELSSEYAVLTLDLRNHGQSPQGPDMDYAHLVADVSCLIRERHPGPVHLLGHSLGGKVAMALALTNPGLLRTLTVVDIAPVAYRDRYSSILRCLGSFDLAGTTSRTAVDRHLARSIPEPAMRQFLLMNLASTPDGYRWRVNLQALQRALPELLSFPDLPQALRFARPALFLSGAKSDHLRPHHHPIIRHRFPDARFAVIGQAGHWPHVENPQAFLESLLAFLEESPGRGHRTRPE